jgi:hypothetical protein
MVYAALKGKLGGELHALALTTWEGDGSVGPAERYYPLTDGQIERYYRS